MGRQVIPSIVQLRNYVRDMGSIYKKMERTIMSDEFQQAYDLSTESEILNLSGWVERHEYQKIRKWLKTKLEYDLHKLSITILRLMARRLNIPRWNYLTKTNIIEAIEIERRNRLLRRD